MATETIIGDGGGGCVEGWGGLTLKATAALASKVGAETASKVSGD